MIESPYPHNSSPNLAAAKDLDLPYWVVLGYNGFHVSLHRGVVPSNDELRARNWVFQNVQQHRIEHIDETVKALALHYLQRMGEING